MKTGNPTPPPNGRQKIHPHEQPRPSAHYRPAAMGSFIMFPLLTEAHHDSFEMYQLMDYLQAQINQIKKTGLFTSNNLSWLTALGELPFLSYLLLIKYICRNIGFNDLVKSQSKYRALKNNYPARTVFKVI